MRNLGLIGGLGPGATVFYYRELVQAGAGEMLIIHANMRYGLSLMEAGNYTALAEYFARQIDRLARGGAEVAAISAVTPHACIRELEKISALPLVNIVEATRTEILARGLRRVALFGTRFVVASSMFGMLEGVEVLVPEPETIAAIHESYMQTVAESMEGRARLSEIAHQLEVDAIVLAGTDLSLVFNEKNIDFPYIDCTQVHIRAILQALT